MKKTFVIILTLIGFVTFGQENKLDRIRNEINLPSSKELLIGKWVFVKAVDTLGNEFRTEVVSKPVTVSIIMSDIKINNDYTFHESLRIDPENIYRGTWKIKNDNEIQYKRETIAENSNTGYTTDVIIELTNQIMIVQNESNCKYIYMKAAE